MAVDERCGSVVFAEQAAVDVVEPIPGDKPVPAGGTRETLRGSEREPITTGPQSSAQSYYVKTPLRKTHMLVKTDMYKLLHNRVCRCQWWLKVESTGKAN